MRVSRAHSIFLIACGAGALACRSARPASATAPSPAAPPTETRAALGAAIDSMVNASEFANANWGILIVDPAAGDTLYAHNAGKLFMPASNMKILTSATALEHLGPDFRYRTTLVARGSLTDGTLHGDLDVVGRGDPSVSDHMRGDAMAPLRDLADSLAAHGVRHVTGRVRAAGDAFPGDHFGYGWTYSDFEDSYSAPVDELLFNEGFSVLHVHAGRTPGDPVQVETSPAHSYPHVRVNAVTVAPSAAGGRRRMRTLVVRKDSVTWDIVVDGTLAAGDSATIEVTDHDPDAAYVAALQEALAQRGITVEGQPFDSLAASPVPADTLVTLQSPPLRDILVAMLKPSQNQIAEMLFRTLGLEVTGTGRPDSAAAVVRRQLAAWGVVPSEAVVRDGSGLSRYDYVSPRTLVRVLDAMRTSPSFPAFYDALPIAGVDGTIAGRMKGTPAQGNVHAKTGSVALARSLSGYVTTANHRMLIFSFLCNNWTVPVQQVERVQDTIAARLAALRLR